MRKLFLALALSGSLGLASCTTPITASQEAQFIAEVQAGAAAACKVVPTVAAILGVFNVVVGASVSAVVTAICAAVPPPASARYGAIHRLGAGSASYIGVTTVGTHTVAVTGWRTQ